MTPRKVNVQNIYRVWCGATPEEVERGTGAYRHYNETISALALRRGFTPRTGCGVFSALSPNNTERGTYRDMRVMMDAVSMGRSIESVNVSSYGPNKEKARRILHGEDPLDVLGGTKTLNFFKCLIDPRDTEACVIDGHAYSIWIGEYHRMVDAKVTDRVYKAITEDYQFLASVLPSGLIASQIQAVTWLTWRRMHGVDYGASVIGVGIGSGGQMNLGLTE